MKKIFLILIVLMFTGCLTMTLPLTEEQEELIVVAGSTIFYGMTIGTAFYLSDF